MDQTLEFNFKRLSWSPTIRVAAKELRVEDIIERLTPQLTEERRDRFMKVVAGRSRHVVSILENIYDRGNVSAVMRSAEAFGFLEMHLVDKPGARFKAANRVTRGAEKWLDVYQHAKPASVVRDLRERGYKIWTTDLNSETDILDVDWSQPMAFVLGNEKDGVSGEMSNLVDGRFKITTPGFSQSFNLSVAGALIFQAAHWHRAQNPNLYSLSHSERLQCLANYYLRCFEHPERHI